MTQEIVNRHASCQPTSTPKLVTILCPTSCPGKIHGTDIVTSNFFCAQNDIPGNRHKTSNYSMTKQLSCKQSLIHVSVIIIRPKKDHTEGHQHGINKCFLPKQISYQKSLTKKPVTLNAPHITITNKETSNCPAPHI